MIIKQHLKKGKKKKKKKKKKKRGNDKVHIQRYLIFLFMGVWIELLHAKALTRGVQDLDDLTNLLHMDLLLY